MDAYPENSTTTSEDQESSKVIADAVGASECNTALLPQEHHRLAPLKIETFVSLRLYANQMQITLTMSLDIGLFKSSEDLGHQSYRATDFSRPRRLLGLGIQPPARCSPIRNFNIALVSTRSRSQPTLNIHHLGHERRGSSADIFALCWNRTQ